MFPLVGLGGHSLWLGGHSLWLGAVAGAHATAAMMVCRVPHSPAAAVIGATAGTVPGWEFVLLAGAAAAVLVLIGVVGNRLNSTPEYPVYIW
ncbi:HPP family protein [Rhodococcus zopfii]|uniref:HPP family protein n=1 Tax=Rhodococcus zopfii TaxID=43772 RepID=UPI003666690E